MDIEIPSAIRLFFPNPSLQLVYFEALANAFDAGATDISIQIGIDSFNDPKSLKITITDNGNGFNDENFKRFKTLLKPRDSFHKGIGRLVFLEYFRNVEIDSVWSKKRRNFTFKNGFDGVAPVQGFPKFKNNKCTLVFTDFAKERIKSYEDLKPESLKPLIIGHLLPTLLRLHRGNVNFNISVSLETSDANAQKDFFSSNTTITSDDLPSMALVEIKENFIDGFDSINMHFHVEKSTGKDIYLVAYSIDGRTIPTNLIMPSSIPHGFSVIFLFESKIFNASSDSSRQKLLLPDEFDESALSAHLRRELGKVLNEKIPEIKQKNNKTKKNFEKKFPHMLGYFDESSVGLIERDTALDIAQQKLFRDQKKVLQSERLDEGLYEKSLDLSSRSLTEYILYRDKIIGRMKEMNEKNSEADIHNLIVPRYKEYSQDDIVSDIYQNNAWLLDEKFMVFRTILSEARMDTIIDAISLDEKEIDENGRPDIAMIFSADPESAEAVDVVVVEVKKKTNDEKENQYAINQLLDRATKLAEHCPKIQRIWYYAVIEINDQMATRLSQMKWAPLFSKGKVFYQDFPTRRPDGTVIPTPMFVLSFDAVVADAESRNHTFLEILRHGMKKYADMLNSKHVTK